MKNERLRARLELRRSSAAAPHRNRQREAKHPGKGNRRRHQEEAMGSHVDSLMGEYVDVEIADTEVLEGIAKDYRQLLAHPPVFLGPAERRWHEDSLDIVEEELEARQKEATP